MSDEIEFDAESSATTWAAFGDLMSVLLGAFVLILASVIGIQLLLHKRLDKAARLLRETRLTIQEVCAAVVYDNTSYFHRVFRRRYGKSPKEYRSELWETENAT